MNAEYFTLFLEEASEILPEGARALQSGDANWRDEFMRAAHTLKGMAATMGYKELGAWLHKIETAAAEQPAASLQKMWQAVESAVGIAQATRSPQRLVDFVAADAAAAPGPETVPTPAHQATSDPAVARSSALRVAVDDLDQLLDTVGELRTRLRVLGQAEFGSPLWQREWRALRSLAARQNRQAAMLRLSSLRDLARLFRQAVNEAAEQLDKPVHCVIRGDGIRIAREVVEQLRPLIPHIARNAVAHGIEPVETRRARNKPETGMIEFAAEQRGGNVLLVIRDDGGGIDLARLREKALASGKPADLDETGLVELLFEPGFSTKDTTDSVAGRGVGMDAVRAAARAAGGDVTVRHQQGHFFELRVEIPAPLSMFHLREIEIGGRRLAIIDDGWTERDAPPEGANELTIASIPPDHNGRIWLEHRRGVLRVNAQWPLGAIHVHPLTPPLDRLDGAVGFYLSDDGTPRIVYDLS
ncbi:MAG: hypothetical protein D6761_13575 [Candidatus Dadabacteria bacterium]|nr:MAG: hypothetical protein D6761_13575 [Candidatus Dadabacteria bacterium]